MKKLFVVLLAVFVFCSVAMIAIACGGGDETTTTEAVTTTEATSTAMTPAEVKAIGDEVVAEYEAAGEGAVMTDFTGGEVTLEGPVLAVRDKGDKYIIDIGVKDASYPICIYKADMAALGVTIDSLNAWVGQNVQVTGEVVLNPFGSATEIVIKDPSQVVLL